jgi:hypothetical protein
MTDIEKLSKKLFCLIDNNYIEHKTLDKKITELKNKIDKINKTNIVYIQNNELNHNLEEYIDTKNNDNYLILENKSFEHIDSLFENYRNELSSNPNNNTNSFSEDILHEKITEKNNILKSDIQSKMLLIQNITSKSIKKTNDDLHFKIENETITTKNELSKKIQNIEIFFEKVKNDIENKINIIKKNEEILRNFMCTRLDNIENFVKTNETNNTSAEIINYNSKTNINTELINDIKLNLKAELMVELKAELKEELKKNIKAELIDDIKNELLKNKPTKEETNTSIVSYSAESADSRFSALLNDNKQIIIREIFDKLEIILKNNKTVVIKEVFDSFEIVLTNKFLEINKSIMQHVKQNGFDLIFSNKETAYKIETWIKRQIDESNKLINI